MYCSWFTEQALFCPLWIPSELQLIKPRLTGTSDPLSNKQRGSAKENCRTAAWIVSHQKPAIMSMFLLLRAILMLSLCAQQEHLGFFSLAMCGEQPKNRPAKTSKMDC